MKTYFKYLLMMACLSAFESISASEITSITKPIAKFEIVVLDTFFLKKPSVEFKIYKDGMNTKYNMQVITVSGNLKLGATKFTIPLSTPVNYGKIYLRYQKGEQFENIIGFDRILFLMEVEDDIKIIIDKGKVEFKGKGSEKYACAFSLSKNANVFHKQHMIRGELLRKGNYTEGFKKDQLNQDSLFNVRKQILTSYRSNLSNQIYNLMLADIWADYNGALVTGMLSNVAQFIKGKVDEKQLNAVRVAYRNYLKRFDDKFLPEDILAKSFKYCDVLFRREYSFKEAFGNPDSSSFLSRYHAINRNYEGVIRDKVMLINFYMSKVKSEEFELVKKEAVNQTRSALYRTALTNLVNNRTGIAYEFELPDKYGKLHKLSDYKGKVVVVDFWYTGCGNCIVMATKMKPIIKELKSNPKVVFITVSIDGDRYRKLWLESLKSEQYSSKDEINLLAEGITSDIVSYYNVNRFPTLLVISEEGKVITLNPPDPRIDAKKFRDFLLTHL